jgi:putative ABC transport system permease protein
MWRNYVITAWRNMWKYRFYTLINIFGLALGIAACLVIALFVHDEMSYDAYNTKSDRIYRVLWKTAWNEGQLYTANILAPTFRREAPEVETAVRFSPPSAAWIVAVSGNAPDSPKDKRFLEKRFYLADSTLFDVFTLPFVEGSPKGALNRPFTVVLTESMAKKYFGAVSPIGKMLTVNNLRQYEITGVIKDMPQNSHFHADFFGSFTSHKIYHDSTYTVKEFWSEANYFTYFLLREGVSIDGLSRRVPDVLRRQSDESLRTATFNLQKTSFIFEPLRDIHLRSPRSIRGEYKGDILSVLIFSSIAVLILAIACFNYMNLTTARSVRRSREIGVRKSVGATFGNLAAQFYTESAIITSIAFVLALFVLEMLLPRANTLLGKDLNILTMANPIAFGIIALAWLFTILLAGSYPAIFLSSIRPTDVLANARKARVGAAFVRRILVVLQFSISVFLLIAAFVVRDQLAFINNRNIGFDKQHVLVLPIGDRTTRQKLDVLKAELMQTAGVKDLSASSETPSSVQAGYSFSTPTKRDVNFVMTAISTDEAFTRLLNIGLRTGTSLPRRSEQDSTTTYFVMNESAIKKIGWTVEEALQKEIDMNGRKGRIYGVMHDFHFGSLHKEITPLILFSQPNKDFMNLLIKTDGTNLAATLGAIKTVWNRVVPHRPFDIRFLDTEIDALYRAEQRMGTLFTIATAMALVVACLGLVGLVAFAAEARAKEIGVRKVLGASSQQIVMLLAQDFLRLVVVAFVVAAPLAWYAAKRWLESFAYRTELHWWLFGLAGLMTAAFALLTVAAQAYQAATVNPVETLRSE